MPLNFLTNNRFPCKMYPSIRRFDAKSIGVWKHGVGRPTSESTQKWVQRCNFVFRVLYKIQTLSDHDSSSILETDKNCGWIVDITDQADANKECYLTAIMPLAVSLSHVTCGVACRPWGCSIGRQPYATTTHRTRRGSAGGCGRAIDRG